jgi:Domain of unknown function (DUF4388)
MSEESERDEDDDLVIRGDIETTSVPELLRSILSSGETGVLTIKNGDALKQIFILNGRVAYAASNNQDERMGEILLAKGKIGVRSFVEASKRIRPGLRLGAILVELGALESEELISAVELHVKSILMDLFTWVRGEYTFVIRELEHDSVPALNMSTENLILEGIRNTHSWRQVIRALGDIESVYVPTGSNDAHFRLDLSEEEQEILGHVNGRTTVERICDMSYLSNFETCRILWALQVLGVIRRGQAGETAAIGEGLRERQRELDLEDIVEKFNQMFSRIYGFLRGRLGETVDPFMDGCLDEVSRQYGALFDGVDLKQYGRADFEQMLANVADLPPEQRKSLMVNALNELVYVIQLSVRTKHGAQEEAVVSGIIKDGLKKLGVA